mgnify:FL=1
MDAASASIARPNDIRDADLLAELTAAQGTAGYEFKRLNCIARQAERDRLATLKPGQARRARARISIENGGISQENLRHIHSVLAMCSLPYDEQPMHVREYEQRHGRMSLVVEAGKLQAPDGTWSEQPLPYGSRARLLLLHLCSEAIRQKSPTIQIEESLTAFIKAIGFPVTGGPRGTLAAFKQQINALAACRMRIGVWNGHRSSTINTQPFARLDVWIPEHPDQRSLWPSTLTFSRDFYDTLSEHALPVNIHAVKAFSNSPRKLDLMFWLCYRLKNLKKPLRISWRTAQEQFGQGYTRLRDFRTDLAREVAEIKEVFDRLPLSVEKDGLVLKPTNPEAIALPTPRWVHG